MAAAPATTIVVIIIIFYSLFSCFSSSPLTTIHQMSHGPEYVGIGILLLAWLVLRSFVTPYHQLYFANDPRIAFPYAEVERVSTREQRESIPACKIFIPS